jgi:hypothetical protein
MDVGRGRMAHLSTIGETLLTLWRLQVGWNCFFMFHIAYRYLGTTITNQNLIQEEIKRRLNSGNTSYHSVQNLLSSRLLSKNIKNKQKKRINTLINTHNKQHYKLRCGMCNLVQVYQCLWLQLWDQRIRQATRFSSNLLPDYWIIL